MTVTLYAHPFSSYCWKALIALREHAIPFELRIPWPDPQIGAEFAALWPLKKMPVLTHAGRKFAESTIIIEYCDRLRQGGPPLVPADADAALEARFMDRAFDNYVMTPMQTIAGDHLRPPQSRDPYGVEKARETLDRAYDWLETRLAGRAFAAGEAFTLADCAAAPSLFYADWVRPIGAGRPTLAAFRAKLLARPTVAAVVDAARPFRDHFPPGAPERD